MITESYVCALYRYIFDVVNRAERCNIRGTMWEWVEGLVTVDVLHDDVCRAWAVDTL